ncbi:MAG: glycosyltransferase 87 family protein [Blastocatellia bacterium]|nr:glycosyltransferase 87 family protein [Blastocatellia bacterium]
MDKRFSWFRQAPEPRQPRPQGIRGLLQGLRLPPASEWSVERVREEIFLRLNREDIQAIATLFLAITAVMLMTNFMVRLQSRTIFGPHLGADFATFYNAGQIFNSHPPEKIYDAELQRQFSEALFPDNRLEQSYLPYSRAPFLVGIFSLFGRMNYTFAYLLWIVMAGALYFFGFRLLWGSLKSMEQEERGTALLLSVSFMPFIVECLAGGQTSAIGFFSLAAAIAFERRNSLRLSGFTLSLMCYQPALLIFILPMLIVTKRTRTLDGFLLGGALWGGLSWLLVGKAGCIQYAKVLLSYLAHSIGEASDFKLWKYVDLNTFLRLLLGERGAWALIISAGVFLAAALTLIRFWWGAERRSKNYQSLLWSATITWTLVAGLFVGIYDSTLIVISLLLTAHFFYSRAGEEEEPLPPDFQILLVLIYLLPWVTQSSAQWIGVQLYSPALLCLGAYQFRLLKQARLPRPKPAPQAPEKSPMNDSNDDW